MKIGYFSHSSISPSETFIYDLLKGLKDKGLDVMYYSGASRGHNFEGVTEYTGYSESGLNAANLVHKIGRLVGGGRGLLYKEKIQTYYAYKALEKKVVRVPDVAYIDYATSATLLIDYLSDNKIPFVVHVHGYDVTSETNNPFYVTKLQEVFKKAFCVIAASNHIRRLLILLGCPEDKIKVIRLGVNAEDIIPLGWENRKKSSPSVIFLGRLTEKKNPIALIHAFRLVKEKVPTSRFTIIGDGVMREKLLQRVKNLDLMSSVDLLGSLSREKSFPILNQHWVYAQHSVTSLFGDQEGFALSLAEAAAHELPVVSTLHNGIPENVVDQETGFLVREFDFETMAEKIVFLLKNPDIAENMGKAGRDHIIQTCNPGNRVDSIYDILVQAKRKV